MRRALAACLATIVLPLSMSCGGAAGAIESPVEGFQKFWSDFRQAALAGDKDKVAAVTEFPFKTRGPLDSDPVKTHDRAAFLALFDKLLEQDPGLRRESETMRSFLGRTVTVTDKMLGAGGETARVAAFAFQRRGGGWRFTMAYVDE